MDKGNDAMLKNQDIELESNQGVTLAFDKFMRSFEAFKETNDFRLDELEKRGSVDALAIKSSRPALDGGDSPRSDNTLAHKMAFEGYVRKGDFVQLNRLGSKALSVGSEADGGFLVPQETERTVNQSLQSNSPIRGISTVI
jgi:HK97 family phage major capsid protein